MLLTESHHSMRTDYANSVPEIDHAVSAAVTAAGYPEPTVATVGLADGPTRVD